jgi:hypothetical protein
MKRLSFILFLFLEMIVGAPAFAQMANTFPLTDGSEMKAPANPGSLYSYSKFEFSLMGGWAPNPDPSYWNNPADLDFNIGGRFVIWLNPHWGFGGSILYDVIPSNVYNQYSYDASGTYTWKDTTYSSVLELVAFFKCFPFDRMIFPVYLLGGGGVAVGFTTLHDIFTSTDPSEPSYNDWISNPAVVNPMIQAGIGTEFFIGKDWSLFAEAKGDMSIGQGTVGFFCPLDAGAAFHWSAVDAPPPAIGLNGKSNGENTKPPDGSAGLPGEPLKEEKSPVASLLMSVFIPGLGQYYNGTGDEILKGVIQDAGLVSGLALSGASIQISSGSSSSENNASASKPVDSGLALAGFGIFLGSYLWSVIDAPLASDDINRKASKKNIAGDFNLHLALLNDSAFRVVPVEDFSFRF